MLTLRDDTTTDSNQRSSSHNHIDSLHNKSITLLPNQLQAKQHQKSRAHSNNSLSRSPFIDSISTQIPDNYHSSRVNINKFGKRGYLLSTTQHQAKRSRYRHPSNHDYFDFIAIRASSYIQRIQFSSHTIQSHIQDQSIFTRITPKEEIFTQGIREMIGDPPSSLNIISNNIEIIPQEAESSQNHPGIPASSPNSLYNPLFFSFHSYC
ncbi:hypothetical protein TIFTF001_009698 [Ficus carica]|uniref:Uncharacterized protein n=1 Tax=Ficus carica TaxID=3494 RepID=A0AA88D3U0_FICCA|nr:hypothetical protein TIFTF001_009698 [Ficus carica]